ncbi:hypothetical protein [Aliivibrio fischeri]|uniref:hypothetical protein n=1 Tax=Aliivibrio fischeri TaxID=668 RepID=UPI00080E1FD6|nr:hypothetical protein [Aliivibrio fischeri]OCH43648.1 hypothetical protein A6E02_11150 [Aliivibrio fischeri]
MRLVNLILLLILMGLAFYKFSFHDTELAGSRWACNELSKNFISEPYKKYQEITEKDVLYFASSANLTIFQTGELVFKNGERHKYEVIIDASYKVKKNKISLKYTNIDWHYKPAKSPVFVQDLDSLQGFETDLNYIINDEQLYFYNRKKHENTNYLCFSL